MRRKSSKTTPIAKKASRPKVVVSVQTKKKKAASGHKGLFAALGGIAGGYFGGPLGARIGYKAGDLLSTITGHGSYSVNRNTLVKGNSVPSFRLATEGVEIAHREFISDVVGSTGFNLTAYALNPGNPIAFPWLSTIATSFEEYDFLGLVFEYRPSSGSAISATSAALGSVVFATDYNVLSSNFQNKQQMESYEFSSSVVANEQMIHPVECATKSNVLDTMYIRTGAVPAGADQRFYDIGEFQAATVGMQSAYTVGELWVSYHIRLKKPRLPLNGEALRTWSHIVTSPAGSATAASPFGTSGALIRSSSVISGLTTSGNTLSLEYPGNYLISIFAQAPGNTGIIGMSLGSNLSVGPIILGNNASGGQSTFGGSSITGVWLVIVSTRGTGANNTITFSGNGITSGNVDVIINLLPNTLNAERPRVSSSPFTYSFQSPQRRVELDRRFSFMQVSADDSLFSGIDERKSG